MTVINVNQLAALDVVPAVAPPPHIGLYSAFEFNETDIPRWLANGVLIKPHNYGGETAFALWTEDWNVPAADVVQTKDGERPDISGLEPFVPFTVYSFDRNQCGDLSSASRAEVDARVAQTIALLEQGQAETAFATRLISDIAAQGITSSPAANVVQAVSNLEVAFARTGTTGVIHASPSTAAYLVSARLMTMTGGKWYTPLGHLVVFGAGYVDTLGDLLVGTSPVVGWRTPIETYSHITHEENDYIAIAERSVLIGYEKLVAATEIS